MKYAKIVEGQFLSRPNRFIAKVSVNGTTETVHVKNTGRCKELLIPGVKVYLYESDNPKRKTKFDLVCVEKTVKQGKLLINIDSQVPNDMVAEWLPSTDLFSDDLKIKREYTYKKSRFDFYIEDNNRKAFLEVKGVTLENDGIASFPDAPTERGIKHINELIEAVNEGYEAYIVFVIQMKGVNLFKPNDLTHKAFGDILRNACSCGVKIIAVDSVVSSDSIKIDEYVPISLN